MPWSNQGGGGGRKGGGGNGGGPWGQGPWGSGGAGSGGGGQPPDLDEILRRGQDKVKQALRGGGPGEGGVPGGFLFILGLLGLLAVAWYGFTFRINPDEQGIVLRFGKFHRWESSGLHFRLPYPIEEVLKPQVTRQNTIEIGSARSSARSADMDAADSGLMLTGDGSVIDVRFVVYWRIKTENDPKNGQTGVEQYLFNINEPEVTVREVAESAMREIVGQTNLQPLLTSGRDKTQQDVQKLMQTILDSYGSGITITGVNLKEADPPGPVIAAFRDVAAAGQDKERFIKEAKTYADQIVPQAKGEASRIVLGAEGFKQQTVAEATGQAARFLKVYEEYKKAPEVTRQRLFLEMQERVLTGADKIILDSKGGSGVVPYLPLDQLQQKKPSTTEGGPQ